MVTSLQLQMRSNQGVESYGMRHQSCGTVHKAFISVCILVCVAATGSSASQPPPLSRELVLGK